MSGAGAVAPALEVRPSGPPPSARPRLHRSAVPVHEPRPASRVLAPEKHDTQPHVQGTLALVLPDHRSPDGDLPAGPVAARPAQRDPGRTGVLPEPEAWAATFVTAAMEVAGGLRSAGQLVRWTTPDVHALLVRRGVLTTRARRAVVQMSAKPRLRTLQSCTPRPGVCEVGAVIGEPDRVRAIAFRMEGLHGRWRVTALEIG